LFNEPGTSFAFLSNKQALVSNIFSGHFSAPFALILVQNRPQFSSAAHIFFRPLLCSAAEISAGWQH
jgi:hypothetical protein